MSNHANNYPQTESNMFLQNISRDMAIKDSHKLIGLSFMDISKLDNGLETLVADIELGLVSDIRAMEVAMYALHYVASRHEEIAEIVDLFANDSIDYYEAMRNVNYQMLLARGHLNLSAKSFCKYPIVALVINNSLEMLSCYESYVVMPTIAKIRMEAYRDQ